MGPSKRAQLAYVSGKVPLVARPDRAFAEKAATRSASSPARRRSQSTD
jgi:hypothetical protein